MAWRDADYIGSVVSIKVAVDGIKTLLFAWAKYLRRTHADFQVGYSYGDSQLIGADEVDSRTGVRLNYTIIYVQLCRVIVSFRRECGKRFLHCASVTELGGDMQFNTVVAARIAHQKIL